MPRMVGCLITLSIALVAGPSISAFAQAPFRLAPAVAVEAEDFHIESGWKVIRNGHGNYMVDMIGFNHISGERLLGIDSKDDTASAFMDVDYPGDGRYRLWVRYEYPAFCETRFRVVVQQDGRNVLDHVMGTKDSLRYGFGEPIPRRSTIPPWGPEGLFAEVVNVPELKAGKARIYLKGSAQPQTPGVAANRNIDLLYLTRDTADAWMKHYAGNRRISIPSSTPSATAGVRATRCASPTAATSPPIFSITPCLQPPPLGS